MPPADWRERAERIGDRLRGRDERVRGVAVAGDHPAGRAWEASVLQIVLFRNAGAGPVERGPLTDEDGVWTAVDRVPIGALAEADGPSGREPLAGTLASLDLIRATEPGLREALLLMRDRYHSAEGRAARAERAMRAAVVALDDFRATGLAAHALDALGRHAAAALAARLGEPPDGLRLPRRLRGWGRVAKAPEIAGAFAGAFELERRGPDQIRPGFAALRSLAASHLEARLPEAGAALLPLIERSALPAERAASALEARGDPAGAAWALLFGALEFDDLIERAAGWRERGDYRARAAEVYGSPDEARVAAALRGFRTAAAA